MAPHENIEPAPVIDWMFHAWLARLTLGLFLAALMQAYLDWLVHLTISPGKQAELAQKALRKAIRFTLYAAKEAHKPNSTRCIEPLPQDNRFRDPAWQYLRSPCLNDDLSGRRVSSMQWESSVRYALAVMTRSSKGCGSGWIWIRPIAICWRPRTSVTVRRGRSIYQRR